MMAAMPKINSGSHRSLRVELLEAVQSPAHTNDEEDVSDDREHPADHEDPAADPERRADHHQAHQDIRGQHAAESQQQQRPIALLEFVAAGDQHQNHRQQGDEGFGNRPGRGL